MISKADSPNKELGFFFPPEESTVLMFHLKPQKSAIGQIGDVVVALVALPFIAVAWVASKVISAITDNT